MPTAARLVPVILVRSRSILLGHSVDLSSLRSAGPNLRFVFTAKQGRSKLSRSSVASGCSTSSIRVRVFNALCEGTDTIANVALWPYQRLSDRHGECPRSRPKRHILAPSSSQFDPFVWSGRALQEVFVELSVAVLHQCIRPLIGACAPGHHGYQRACVLISRQASTGPSGSPVFACVGKTDPPSLLILSQTSAGNG
jgi:hypothetical protein